MTGARFQNSDCEELYLSQIEEPLVSVIIPVYNTGQTGYLQECINSLNAQTLKPIELIFIDDNSKDDSLNILRGYAATHSNVTVLHMKKNKRQGAARNRGIAYARGRFIGLVDSDDLVPPSFFASLYFKAYESGADVVSAPFVRVNDKGKPLDPVVKPYELRQLGVIDDEKRKWLILNHQYLWLNLYEASIVKGEPFPEEVQFEDNPTCLRWIYKYHKMEQVESPPYHYRVNPYSTTSRNQTDIKQIEDRIATSDMMLRDAVSIGTYSNYKEEIDYFYTRSLYITGIRCLARGRMLCKDNVMMLTDHLKSQVPNYKRNRYLIEQTSFLNRLMVLVASLLPGLLCILLTPATAAYYQFKKMKHQ